jgi:ABC-type multidrug transport system fused ATPase/permease subunit
MDIFGAMFGIFLSAGALPQLSTILESLTQARVACYLAQETINRKVEDVSAKSSSSSGTITQNKVEATIKMEEGVDTSTVRHGGNKLPEYKINSLSPDGLQPKKLKGDIEFKNVTFAYPTRMQQHVFENFSLKIEHGKSIAICGPSVRNWFFVVPAKAVFTF